MPEGLLVLWAPHQAGARRAAGALGPAPGRTGQPPRKLIPRASKQVSRPSECFPEPRSGTLPIFSACTPFITLLFFDRASRSAFSALRAASAARWLRHRPTELLRDPFIMGPYQVRQFNLIVGRVGRRCKHTRGGSRKGPHRRRSKRPHKAATTNLRALGAKASRQVPWWA